MAKGTRASPRGRSAAGGEGGQKQSEGLSLGRHGAGRQSSRGHVRSGDTGRADGRQAQRAAPHLRPREAAGWRRRAAPVRTAGVAAADTSPAAVRRGAAAASRRPLAATGATERSPPGPAGPAPGGRGRASMCSRKARAPASGSCRGGQARATRRPAVWLRKWGHAALLPFHPVSKWWGCGHVLLVTRFTVSSQLATSTGKRPEGRPSSRFWGPLSAAPPLARASSWTSASGPSRPPGQASLPAAGPCPGDPSAPGWPGP